MPLMRWFKWKKRRAAGLKRALAQEQPGEEDKLAWLFPRQEYLFRKIYSTDDPRCPTSEDDKKKLSLRSLAVTNSALSNPLRWLQGHLEQLKKAFRENCNEFRVLEITLFDRMEDISDDDKAYRRDILYLLMGIIQEFLAYSSTLEELHVSCSADCEDLSIQFLDQILAAKSGSAATFLPLLKHVTIPCFHQIHCGSLLLLLQKINGLLQSVTIGMDDPTELMDSALIEWRRNNNRCTTNESPPNNCLRRLILFDISQSMDDAISNVLPTLTLQLEELQILPDDEGSSFEKVLTQRLPNMSRLQVLVITTYSADLIQAIVQKSPSLDYLAFSYYGSTSVTFDLSRDLPRKVLRIVDGENLTISGSVPREINNDSHHQTLQDLSLSFDLTIPLDSFHSLANLKSLRSLNCLASLQKEDGSVTDSNYLELVKLIQRSDSIVDLGDCYWNSARWNHHQHSIHLNRLATRLTPQIPLGLVPYILARLAGGGRGNDHHGKPSLIFSALREKPYLFLKAACALQQGQ